ncbi:MAG: polysaccharide deacetylase family protein [Pyrinomonadaceae bacterium]|nr:polysaccharide deacetylase family protein [Pyrinomonadaceae bacterium]
MNEPLASLSLDLDNKWSYMKTHGDDGWEKFPSYLDIVVPRVLKFLRTRNLKITFFVVGQDAHLSKNKESLSRLSVENHEIGNHSFNHEPWLHLYSKQQVADELERAETAIFEATNQKPIGFRGPGFSLSKTVLETLANRGYKYDCSTFPTYLAPLARAFYFMNAKGLSPDERQKRKQLFGKFSDGFQTLKPFAWQINDKTLLEIPVTTLPFAKTPIHASYLLYLSSFSAKAAEIYWRNALRMCRLTRTPLSLLLHPLDFLGADDESDLNFFPGMNLQSGRKLDFVGKVLDLMAKDFQIVTMRQHAESLDASQIKSKPLAQMAL